MKKLLTLIFISVFCLNAINAEITWNIEDDGTLTISGTDMPNYSSNSYPWYSQKDKIKRVIIEDGVKNIGNCTFSGCIKLSSITIPNSVTSIGNSAFSGCKGLILVTIPNSVTSIGHGAFTNCAVLTSVTIPNSVTNIGSNTFKGCKGLTSITIPNSVTSIGSSAFEGCSGLTSVAIPNTVTSIEDRAFSNCTSLTSVEIPNSITSIGNNTFYYCHSLKSITIPNSVTRIGESAFEGCMGLTSVTIGNSVESIGNNAFKYCIVKSITIPNSVWSIGDNAFERCVGLTSVTIGNSVTSIGDNAFDGCSILKKIFNNSLLSLSKGSSNNGGIAYSAIAIYKNVSIDGDFRICKDDSGNSYVCDYFGTENNITIPNGIYGIADYAFYDCSGLTSVTIPNSVTSIGNEAFMSCSGLQSITMSNSITSIGNEAFRDCSCLASFTIPNSVTSIGSYAFYYCSGLTSIICKATTPPICDVSFSYVNKSIPVYVPANNINEYKIAKEWKDFTNIQPIVNTETYTVTLDHNKGNGDPEQITVTYNQPMPENIGLVAPTRKGYEFTGYSRNETFYYDANLKSVRNFDKQQDYTLYASWKACTTTVTLNPQGGQNGTAQVTATYAKAMPTGEDIVAPTRAGYTFEGYYTSTNGKGTQYYNADMTSTRSWYRDASTATLYAYWKTKVPTIDLSATEATLWVGKTKTITATVNSTDASNATITWSSSNTQVATVTTKGVIKAIGKGTCIITCTAADGYGTKAECEVTVKQQVTSIDFGYETLSITCGTTKSLKPKIYPSNADVQTLTWRSKNTSVAKVSSEGVLTAIAPGTAQIICTATDGFWKADTITVEVVPLKITDSKPTIADGTYGAGGISYTRTLTEGKYAAFCLPYNVNLNDYTEEFSKVFVPMGMTFLKTNGTLMVIFKNVSMTETIRAGKPFVALAAKSGSVSIVNDAKKTFTDLTNPTPTDLDVYNWNGSNGFLTSNPDITVQMGGTYSKLTGLDSEKYYMVSTGGSIGKATSISPYRIYIYKDDNNSNAKVTEIIFSFDEDAMATGVEDIINEQKGDGKYYNLNGQRINKSNAQKGIYIINGKKVVLK